MKTIVARNLKLLRETAGYTQKAVAEFIGVDRGAYANYESESPRLMPFDLLNKVCELYGISLKSLINENAVKSDFVCAFRISLSNSQDISEIANFKKVVRDYLQMCTYKK